MRFIIIACFIFLSNSLTASETITINPEKTNECPNFEAVANTQIHVYSRHEQEQDSVDDYVSMSLQDAWDKLGCWSSPCTEGRGVPSSVHSEIL